MRESKTTNAMKESRGSFEGNLVEIDYMNEEIIQERQKGINEIEEGIIEVHHIYQEMGQ